MSSGVYLSNSFLYINMGCHMLFVLKNRLKAQSIPLDKALKIINDILMAIFKESFIKTLLLPQQPMSVAYLKDIFRRLAHSSIMKLDQASMDKLVYLILMTVKKEVFLLSSSLELYSLTLGNMITLLKYVEASQGETSILSAINYFKNQANKFNFMQYQEIREHILSMLENIQTKVINFTESGHQNQKGKLIFVRRNAHNQHALGTTINHKAVQFKINVKEVPKASLYYSDWVNWKSNLVLDYAEEYQKQSEKRHLMPKSTLLQNQKSISDLFNINEQHLDDYEVRLDILENQDQFQQKSQIHSKKIEAKAKGEVKSTVNTVKNLESEKLKSKIEKQFANLEVKEEELDLLDMMDN